MSGLRILILFAELLAGLFVLFIFELHLDMTHNDSLDFGILLSVCLGETGTPIALLSDLLCERGLSVTGVKLICVSCSMHHKLLRFEIISLGDKVRHDVRMLWKKSFVIDFLPLEFLSVLGVGLGIGSGMAYSWKAKVLKVEVSDEVELTVCKIIIIRRVLNLRLG